MVSIPLAYYTLFFCSLAVYATPLPTTLSPRWGVSALSSAQTMAFQPYSFYAAAAYCAPSTTLSWTCGSNCAQNPGFLPVASGGDGTDTQYWNVGYDPGLQTIIVGHQGTDPHNILPVLTDIDIILSNLDGNLFPGIDSSVMVHSGFRDSQARAANDVLAAVQTAMSQYNATQVTLVGHSMGGALSLLDSIFLPLHLPPQTVFQTITYALPRVGNQAFADYVDANLNLTHVNNMEDIVPVLPGRFFGYVHPSGEVHIQDSGEWVSCSGQDNSDPQCIVGDVPTIFQGSLSFHDGPYNGANMNC